MAQLQSEFTEGRGMICNTAFGRFKVLVDNDNIKVGAKNYCVNIALHPGETTLYWLGTEDGGCELDEKIIEGNDTVKMVDLAFSLLRKYYPERNTEVTLLDDSGITWKDKKGKKYKTTFLKGYLLIHHKTWYEDKFHAVMTDPKTYADYREKADNNFNNPSKKPKRFNFMNSDIQRELEPIYEESKTWAEFTEKIGEIYKKDKYRMMYDWYRQAIYVIFDGMEINQQWKIDISKRPHIECNPLSRQSGGSKRTRKNRRITFSKYRRIEPFHWSP